MLRLSVTKFISCFPLFDPQGTLLLQFIKELLDKALLSPHGSYVVIVEEAKMLINRIGLLGNKSACKISLHQIT